MSESSVRYLLPGGQLGTLPICFFGPNQTFRLGSEAIAARLVAEIEDRLLDFLEIAAAVFAADSSISRGALYQPRHGLTWRRRMEFSIAVRDLEFWEQPAIAESLRDLVRTMSDDDITVRFSQAETSRNLKSYFPFDPASSTRFQIDTVIMFSGGLDSLTGAVDILKNTDERIALVTHLSASKTSARQTRLIKALTREFPGRILWIPVWAHRRNGTQKERTQRTRTLLFAALGFLIARMLGAESLRFFENGIVSQNLPLAAPIVGTLATRTTHPLTLQKLSGLLATISGRPFRITNDFQWMTKTEVVARLGTLGWARLISDTVSCNDVIKSGKDTPHCGSCSQCLDRRFAVLACGFGEHDPSEKYRIEPLHGARDDPEDRKLAVQWLALAVSMTEISADDFLSRFGGELPRVAEAYGDTFGTYQRSHELHQKHGQAVRRVLTAARAQTSRDLPATALLAVAGNPDGIPSERLPADYPSDSGSGGAVSSEFLIASFREMLPLELRLKPTGVATVTAMTEFRGAQARLIHVLAGYLEEDRGAGRGRTEIRLHRLRDVSEALGIDEEYARKIVDRIRDDLEESWAANCELPHPPYLLIENMPRRGYRLDPSTVVIREP